MIKNIFAGFLLLLCSFGEIKAQTITDTPTEISVKQRWLSLTNTFDIAAGDRKLGIVKRAILSWTPQYQFFDTNDVLQAKAKMRFFSLGATFDVWNANEELIGRVDERITVFFPTFDIYRGDGYHAAKAKLNFWGTKYTVSDPDTNDEIAHLTRNFLRFKEDWKATIVNPTLFAEKNIDVRLFVIVMVLQTDYDMWATFRFFQNKNALLPKISQDLGESEILTLQNSVQHHRDCLETYRESFGRMEPSHEDIQSVEEIVDRKLDEMELAVSQDMKEELQHKPHEVAKAQIIEKGISIIMPLLSSDELSTGQKSALFHLMDQMISE